MSDKCKSCGVPYTKHLGIQSTCFSLKLALHALEDISTMPRQARAQRYARETWRMITDHIENAQKLSAEKTSRKKSLRGL